MRVVKVTQFRKILLELRISKAIIPRFSWKGVIKFQAKYLKIISGRVVLSVKLPAGGLGF